MPNDVLHEQGEGILGAPIFSLNALFIGLSHAHPGLC